MDSPIVRASLTAACLSGLSNCIAQCITCFQTNHISASEDIPTMITIFISAIHADFKLTDLFHFFLFSLLACPPNYIWQSWLEGRFPGYREVLAPMERERLVDDATTGRSTGKGAADGGSKKRGGEKEGAMTEESTLSNPATAAVKARRQLNIFNTFAKFLLDQSIGAAANTVLFIAGIALLRGSSWETIHTSVRTQFWPLIRAGQKLWPIVSVAQFTVVPFEYRTLVGSIVGLVWGVLLSLMSTPKGKVAVKVE